MAKETLPPKFPMTETRLKSMLNAYELDCTTPSVSQAYPVLSPGHHAVQKKGSATPARITAWRWIIQDENKTIAVVEQPIGKNMAASLKTTPKLTKFMHPLSHNPKCGVLLNPLTQDEYVIILHDDGWRDTENKSIAPLLDAMRKKDA